VHRDFSDLVLKHLGNRAGLERVLVRRGVDLRPAAFTLARSRAMSGGRLGSGAPSISEAGRMVMVLRACVVPMRNPVTTSFGAGGATAQGGAEAEGTATLFHPLTAF